MSRAPDWQTLPLEVRQQILFEYLQSYIPDSCNGEAPTYLLDRDYGYHYDDVDSLDDIDDPTEEELNCPDIPLGRPLCTAFFKLTVVFKADDLKYALEEFVLPLLDYKSYLQGAESYHFEVQMIADKLNETYLESVLESGDWTAKELVGHISGKKLVPEITRVEKVYKSNCKRADQTADKLNGALADTKLCAIFVDHYWTTLRWEGRPPIAPKNLYIGCVHEEIGCDEYETCIVAWGYHVRQEAAQRTRVGTGQEPAFKKTANKERYRSYTSGLEYFDMEERYYSMLRSKYEMPPWLKKK